MDRAFNLAFQKPLLKEYFALLNFLKSIVPLVVISRLSFGRPKRYAGLRCMAENIPARRPAQLPESLQHGLPLWEHQQQPAVGQAAEFASLGRQQCDCLKLERVCCKGGQLG